MGLGGDCSSQVSNSPLPTPPTPEPRLSVLSGNVGAGLFESNISYGESEISKITQKRHNKHPMDFRIFTQG